MKFGKIFAGIRSKKEKDMKEEEKVEKQDVVDNNQENPKAEESVKAEESANPGTDDAKAEEPKAADAKSESTESDAAATPADDELTSLQKKIAESRDSYLRLMAEYDNYKKRTLKEKSDLLKYGGANIIKNLLPVIDDFARALANMPEENSPVKEGVELIYKKFMAFLDQNHVKAIPTKDTEFNTDFHEAATLFPAADENQKNKVIDCIQKGYTYNDKVIRFAKVVVAQ